jgi:hypothetical protein
MTSIPATGLNRSRQPQLCELADTFTKNNNIRRIEMSDIKVPNEIANWMDKRGWGDHHDQWHWERRWDYWKAMLENPNIPDDWKQWIKDKFSEADTKGWKRAAIQEGAQGNGEEFLFMHRAMIDLLVGDFPQHYHFFRGWHTPPTDHASVLDPVPVPNPEPTGECAPTKKLICDNMLAAIAKIEGQFDTFTDDDAFGRFIETNLRPTATDPLARSADKQTGIHNYLHGRWSGMSADLDLGDPRFNIYNTRFWRLHGWIDHQWWLFRQAKGSDDSDASYQKSLDHYKKMMNMTDHAHHELAPLAEGGDRPASKNAFIDLAAEFM